MKINSDRIPSEGLIAEDEIDPAKLEINTDFIKFKGKIKVKAFVTKITNAVTIELDLTAVETMICGRCLSEFDVDLNKKLNLNYSVDRKNYIIDLDPDIRENIILDYPLKPLCSVSCMGICPKCGEDLNKGICKCS